MPLFDKRMQKAETVEMTEKGWAGWIRIILGKVFWESNWIALAIVELVCQVL